MRSWRVGSFFLGREHGATSYRSSDRLTFSRRGLGFRVVRVPRRVGDFDGEGDVYLSAFMIFQQCFGGSNNPPTATCPPGTDPDQDGDGDVDLADFLIFQQNFTGSQ